MRNGLQIDEDNNGYWYEEEDGSILERYDDHEFWWKNDQLHRVNGPAVTNNNGDEFWYQNYQLHRIDGPAVEYANGGKEWYYRGEYIDCSSQEEFEKYLKLKLFW